MTTAVAVIGVAATAAAVSYEHAGDLVRAHGETGWTARLIPLTVDGSTDDGLIYASLLVMLDSARRGARAPALARWLLGLGHVLIGAAVGTWPAVALVGSHELLMMVIRGAQADAPTWWHADDRSAWRAGAAVVFAADLAADGVPSVRAIRSAQHLGQLRAQRLREYLAVATVTRGGRLAV